MERGKTQALRRFVLLSLSGFLVVLPFSVIERYLFVLLRHPHPLLSLPPICIIPLHYPKWTLILPFHSRYGPFRRLLPEQGTFQALLNHQPATHTVPRVDQCTPDLPPSPQCPASVPASASASTFNTPVVHIHDPQRTCSLRSASQERTECDLGRVVEDAILGSCAPTSSANQPVQDKPGLYRMASRCWCLLNHLPLDPNLCACQQSQNG